MELRAMIEATESAIAETRHKISLIRKEDVRTPAGGIRKGNPVTLDEKTRGFSSVSGDPIFVTTDHGEQIRINYTLVGMPDDDILKDDEFKIGKRKFRVVWVDPSTTAFQTLAYVLEIA